MKKLINFIMIILFTGIIACKSPVLITATKENLNNINCEVAFITNNKYTSIEDFKTDYKNKVVKETNRCKCDTLYIDINDVFKTNYENVIGGGCIERKK